MAEAMVSKGQTVDMQSKSDSGVPRHSSRRKSSSTVISSGSTPKQVSEETDKGEASSATRTKPPATSVLESSSEILQKLNQILVKQNEQEQALSSVTTKVDELYYYDDTGVKESHSWNEHDMPDEEMEVDDTTVVSQLDKADKDGGEPPCKKSKTEDVSESKFKNLTEQYELKEKTVESVNSDLSDTVNKIFWEGLPDEKYQDMIKNLHRPDNCKALVKIKVNSLVWNVLRPQTRSQDVQMQNVQEALVKGSVLITKLADKLGSLQDVDQETISLATDALAILGHSNKLLNQKRRDMIKPDICESYKHLCSPTTLLTSQLFGDDCSKNVKDIQDVNKVGNTLTGRGRGRRRGGRFGPRGIGRGRGQYRGRGFSHGRNNSWSGSGWNQNWSGNWNQNFSQKDKHGKQGPKDLK